MKCILFSGLLVAITICATPEQSFITPGENLVLDGVPKIPASVAEGVKRYKESRDASQTDWHPDRREMLISTRFGNTYQAHIVKMPGGARQQLTFFDEPVRGALYHPDGGDYVLYQKDVGGGEWYQFFRFDLLTRENTLLTDGQSRNTSPRWSNSGNQIAYVSTRRSRKDNDLWVMDPSNPKTDHLLTQMSGGGWWVMDWSPDDGKILLVESLSRRQSYLWLVDAKTGEKTEVARRKRETEVGYGGARFSKDGKAIYVTTDKDSEFRRLASIDLKTNDVQVLTPDLLWDVDEFELSSDGKWMAYLSNEDGVSKLHLINMVTHEEMPMPSLSTGLLSGLVWRHSYPELGFTMETAKDPADCYSLDVTSGKLERWTDSETAVNTSDFRDAELIRWKTFDGRMISGFVYKPPAKFTGKRPVLIDIHGGPEGQSRPGFLGSDSYYLNELGIALVKPNVRGSTGYGKSFSNLDNGFLREGAYRDINALIDWIASQPDLDAERIAVTGGSYGGNVTLAISAFYSARIRCAIDIVGPSNLVTFLENTEAYRRDLRRAEYGDERNPRMREFLERIAPMNNIEKIRRPLLVVAGKNDPRTPVTESDRIVAGLKEQGTPVWYLMAKDEGHGYQKRTNEDFLLYTTVEFLRQYLLK